MAKIKVTGQRLISIAVVGLTFVLGVVVGHRYIEPGSIPFLPAPNRVVGLYDQRQIENTAVPTQVGSVNFNQFWEVWQIIERDYIDPGKIDRQTMVHGAIQGMAAAVGDPYTVFLPPVEDKRAAEELAGAFYGIGIELGYREGVLSVVAPLRGMPADKAGILAGDLILRVTDPLKDLDEETNGWSLSTAVEKIRGEKGTKVQLTLLRPDDPNRSREPFELEIPRDEIIIPTVDLEIVEHDGKKVAHIILSRFGERTEQEWDAIVDTIQGQESELNGVVLDMRNNPGGYFDQAIVIASEFIKKGTIVSQQGRVASKPFPASGDARLDAMPITVLVNRGSASASEIVAGALRDLKKAPLIGEHTFGKGTVQDRRSVSGGAGLHVTVAQWLMPNGEKIPDDGLKVDIEVSNDPETEQDEVLLEAIKAL